MNLTDSETLKFMKGSPVLLDDICAVYCATVGEIVDLGYDKFQTYLGAITMTKPILKKTDSEMAQIISKLTNFQYILMLTAFDTGVNDTLKESFQFFCHENVSFSLNPPQIIIGPIEEQHFLSEEKFYDLQKIIRRMYFIDIDGEEIDISEEDNPQLRALKIKMLENREKVRRAKAKQAAKDNSDLKFSDLIGSITINNCGLNMENIWNITYYALQDQLKRMGWRDQFEINNRAALAGAKINKSQLKHWMRSISNTDK